METIRFKYEIVILSSFYHEGYKNPIAKFFVFYPVNQPVIFSLFKLGKHPGFLMSLN